MERTVKRLGKRLREDPIDVRTWSVPHIILGAYSESSDYGRFLRHVGKGDGIVDTIWQCILFNVRRERNYGCNLMRTCKGMGDRITYITNGAKPTLRHYVREAKLIADGQITRSKFYKRLAMARISDCRVKETFDYFTKFKKNYDLIAVHYYHYEERGVWYLPVERIGNGYAVGIYSRKWKQNLIFYKWDGMRTTADWSRMNLYIETMGGFGDFNHNYHTWDLDKHVRCGYL